MSDPRDLCHLRYFIRVTRRHDETKLNIDNENQRTHSKMDLRFVTFLSLITFLTTENNNLNIDPWINSDSICNSRDVYIKKKQHKNSFLEDNWQYSPSCSIMQKNKYSMGSWQSLTIFAINYGPSYSTWKELLTPNLDSKRLTLPFSFFLRKSFPYKYVCCQSQYLPSWCITQKKELISSIMQWENSHEESIRAHSMFF